MQPTEIPAIFVAGKPVLRADLRIAAGPDSVLVIPGFWRLRTDPVMRRISARLHQSGLTVCTPDNRGHGESLGTFGFNTHESDDVIRILEFLRHEGMTTAAPCVLGFSAGGAIAISAAARRPDLIRGLVLISPVADFKRVLPRPNPFRLGSTLSIRSMVRPPRFWWYENTRRHALDDAEHVRLPVCLVHARNDWLVHHSHSEQIAARLPRQPELHVPDLDRAHAERLLDLEGAPWPPILAFMRSSLGMSLSGA